MPKYIFYHTNRQFQSSIIVHNEYNQNPWVNKYIYNGTDESNYQEISEIISYTRLDPPRVWYFSPLTTKNRPRGWNLTPLQGLGTCFWTTFNDCLQTLVECSLPIFGLQVIMTRSPLLSKGSTWVGWNDGNPCGLPSRIPVTYADCFSWFLEIPYLYWGQLRFATVWVVGKNWNIFLPNGGEKWWWIPWKWRTWRKSLLL